MPISPTQGNSPSSSPWPNLIDPEEAAEEEPLEDPELLLESLKETFWQRFHITLEEGNFAALFELTLEYKPDLQGEVNFYEMIQEEIVRVGLREFFEGIRDEDYDIIRKVAAMDQLLNPFAAFPRLIQALCYFLTDHPLPAYTILKSMEEVEKEIQRTIDRNEYSNPFLSKKLKDLLLFFITQKKKIKDNPDKFYQLRV